MNEYDKYIKRQNESMQKAEQVMRSHDKRELFDNRSGMDYHISLGGLEHFFGYARQLHSKKILDIGTGSGRAISNLRSMPMGRGLQFDVTNLSQSNEVSNNIKGGEIFITSAEKLQGIPDAVYAGVTGVFSIGYAIPNLAIKSIDRVLIPGGILKTNFLPYGKSDVIGSDPDSSSLFRDPMSFLVELAKLKYDIGQKTIDLIIKKGDNDWLHSAVVILAIKPGNKKAPKAQDLIDEDWEDLKHEAVESEKGFINGVECPVFRS